jgi:hypothetical protein
VLAGVDARRWVWVLDEAGAVVAQRGSGAVGERFTGHPLFVATQTGIAADGLLSDDSGTSMVGAVPVVRDNEARGAVFVGTAVDAQLVSRLSVSVGNAGVSVLGAEAKVLASSLSAEAAREIAAKLPATYAAKLDQPLPGGGTLGGSLPLLVSKTLDGRAFASNAKAAPSGALTWVVSVSTATELANLGVRQEIELGIFVAALLLALVIGLVLHRTFVRPIEVITQHLSEFTQGRGERELADAAVSAPFRRLVKLVNMRVQRAPTGAYGFPDPRLGDEAPALGLGSFPPSGRVDPPRADAAAEPSSAPLAPAVSATPRPVSARAVGTPMRAASGASLAPPAASGGFGSGPTSPSLGPPVLATASVAAPGVAAAVASTGGLAAPSLVDLPSDALDDSLRAMGVQPGASVTKRPRGASEIRGTPSSSLLDFDARAPSAVPVRSGSGVGAVSGLPSTIGPAEDLPIPSMVPERAGSQVSARPRSGSTLGASISPASMGTSRMGGSAAAALTGGAGVNEVEDSDASDEFKAEATVVAAPDANLLAASAQEQATGAFASLSGAVGDRTVVAKVPQDLLAEARGGGEDDKPEDTSHYRETYEAFVALRRQCGESLADLAYDRFVQKLRKNRDGLIAKYQCRTVRFQVYEKDGKAALKATPVR